MWGKKKKESKDSERCLEISIYGQPEGKAVKGSVPKLLGEKKRQVFTKYVSEAGKLSP